MRKLGSLMIASVVVALAAGCGSSGTSGGDGPPRGTSTTTSTGTVVPAVVPAVEQTVDPEAAALALAHRMVAEVVLPPGAVPSSAPLPELLRGPFQTPSGGNVVGANREWTVAEDPDAVVAFLKSHAPAGFTESGVGSSGSPTEHAQDVIEQLLAVPANVAEAGLEIGVEAAPGGSLLNVYGGVQWTQVRPTDEYVPSDVHVVIISVVRVFEPGKPVARRVVVTDRATVARIARTFDALAVAPPGQIFNCYMLRNDAVSYRIAFAASATAEPDLVATAAACSTTAVTVGGHVAPALSASLGAFGDAVAHALGKSQLNFE